MSKNYLNVGCGHKYDPSWTNIDMVSTSEHVKSVNLIKGIAYPTDQFKVVYHSQVLEHIPRLAVGFFISECFRVLQSGGIMRVVTPDLENITREYLRNLESVYLDDSQINIFKYRWSVLELLDQSVRIRPGGAMVDVINSAKDQDEAYLKERIGLSLDKIRERSSRSRSLVEYWTYLTATGDTFRTSLYKGWWMALEKIGILSEAKRTGLYRLGGEVHEWLYDRYSLGSILRQAGFVDIKVLSPTESQIDGWDRFNLDTVGGGSYDPTSLYIEARKP